MIPYIRTKQFKSTFFPSFIFNWNQLNPDIKNSSSLEIFKRALLKFIRHKAADVYKIHHPRGLKLLTRLRLALSYLLRSVVMMADGQAVKTFSEENSKTYFQNVIEVINKIKKKQKGQYEDTIIEFCAKDYEMDKNKVLESLSYGVENKYLKKVLNNNKTSYRVIKVALTLDENCIIVDDDVMINEQDNGDENTEKLRHVEFEFISFKRFILGEFCDVKESLLADLQHFKRSYKP